MEELRMLLAWCELRGDFRHFRTDRIQRATALPDRIPEPPARLIRRWHEADRARLAARAGQAQ